MSPFKRGQFWSLYVPRQSGGVVQRACGTTDAKLAGKMGRMIDTLADTRRWDVLQAIDSKVLTVGAAYDAYCSNALDAALEKANRKAKEEAEPLAIDYVDKWIASLKQAPSTLVSYEQKVRTLLADDTIDHTLRVSELTGGWLMDRLGVLDFTAATIRQYAHAFGLFCRYLKAHKKLTDNPLTDVSLPKGTNKRKVWKPEADDRRLVDASPEPFRSYFALVHATGAERNAALAMVRSDLNFAEAVCHIPGTKNEGRDRSGVPIEPWAIPILKAHCVGLLPDAPLFPTLSSGMVNKAHIEARKVAKLPGYQLRDGRHSFAVRAILRGEPLWAVSKWLGHANIGITAAVYANFGLEAAMAELNRSATPRATRGGVSS